MTGLPDAKPPHVVIAPGRGRAAVDPRELWSYRELLYFFVWRDVKVRYKQTAFGALWAIGQPLALMAVFSLFLGRVSGLAPEGIPYPVFVLAALVPWTLFADGLLGASMSLTESSNLIQKVYFPRILLTASAIGSYLIDFLISLAVLAAVLVANSIELTPRLLAIVPLTAILLTAALGFGSCLAAINVKYRDVRYALPFILQLWLFATPVAYASSVVPEEWLPVYRLNPLVGVVEGFRWATLPGAPFPISVVAAAVTSVLVLAIGLGYFRRVERTFSDLI